MIGGLLPSTVDRALVSFLEEDLPEGDLTSRLFFSDPASNRRAEAAIMAEESGVLAGTPFIPRIFSLLGGEVAVNWKVPEGGALSPGQVVGVLSGPLLDLLSGERLSLNLLKHLSAIATTTRRYVEAARAVRPSGMRPLRITETRKTLPGLRLFQKYAVRMGGGVPHRSSLSSGILIKDNHIVGVGSVARALRLARERAPHPYRIEIEVDTPGQALEAVAEGAEILLLDNMSVSVMADLVPRLREKNPDILLEVSGGVTLEKVREISGLDIDLCSVGALTHSPGDLSLRLDFLG